MTGLEAEPALRRTGNDGNENLRPADGVAELDLPAAECCRREGRAEGMAQQGRPEFDWKHELKTITSDVREAYDR